MIEIKDGVKEFIEIINRFNILLIVFSAGVYNLIHKYLERLTDNLVNIHVVSNIFEFDSNSKFIGTKGEIIHSMNKTYDELMKLPIAKELRNKSACIVIGDSINDLRMARDSDFDIVLRIGFFNFLKNDELYDIKLKEFREKFDILFWGHEDFSKINELLKEILGVM